MRERERSALVSIEHDDTLPLRTWVPSWASRGRGEETFATYLRRHHLTILQAAHAAALPLALVWRAAHALPISEQKARKLVAALAQMTGEGFAGLLLTIQQDARPHVTNFFTENEQRAK